jgi:hypothetical protein
VIRRFSSRRQKLDKSFLAARLTGAKAYDRIAGYKDQRIEKIDWEKSERVLSVTAKRTVLIKGWYQNEISWGGSNSD